MVPKLPEASVGDSTSSRHPRPPRTSQSIRCAKYAPQSGVLVTKNLEKLLARFLIKGEPNALGMELNVGCHVR